MFEKFLLCLVVVLALIALASADFSCFFGDTICKSITCRMHLPRRPIDIPTLFGFRFNSKVICGSKYDSELERCFLFFTFNSI
ncbi:hypothetical protein Q1695_003984 [Nippostrongylus brasiliensis]|nr:hypothetical protein Q1695_003984 [Nippostrongylus brasiliensis]